MEGHKAVDRPLMGKPSRAVRGTGNGPREGRREVLARVEVAVAVLSFRVGAVERNSAAISADLVEFMRPGVCDLRVESVPSTQTQRGLQRVVVRCADAVELVHRTKVGILRIVAVHKGSG